jgi:hypothetical protein
MESWEALARDSNGLYTVEEFKETAYRLVSEQVIYRDDQGCRTAYQMVAQYERHFSGILLDLFGVQIRVNRRLQYAYAIPLHETASRASQAQTLMALVLRRVYDDLILQGVMNDRGEVIIDDVELAQKYKLMISRELPNRGELDALLRQMKRWGIAQRDTEGATDHYGIIIRPAIVDVLGETAITRLARWAEAAQRRNGKAESVVPFTESDNDVEEKNET